MRLLISLVVAVLCIKIKIVNSDCNLRACAVWSPCCDGYTCQTIFQVCGKTNCRAKENGSVPKGCGCKKKIVIVHVMIVYNLLDSARIN